MIKTQEWPRILQKLRDQGYRISPLASGSSDAGFDLFLMDLSHWRLRFSAYTPVISIAASRLHNVDADELADTVTDLAGQRGWNHRECFVLVGEAGPTLKPRLRRSSSPYFVVCDLADQNRVADAGSPTHALLDLVTAQLPLTTLAPYQVSGSLVEGVFFGREKEIGRILRHEEVSFAVVGIRRVGKTWLLHEVENRLKTARKDGTRHLYLDTSTFKTVDSLLHTIVRLLDTREFMRIQKRRSYPFDFLNFLRLTAKRLSGPMTFYFDEADSLIKLAKTNSELLRILRASISAGYCRCMLAGFDDLLREICDRESPLYFGLELIELKTFVRSETHDMVITPMESLRIHIEESEKIVSRIHAETRGLPFFVQYYCRELIEQIERRGDATLRPQDVDSIYLSEGFKTLVLNAFRDNVSLRDKQLVYALLATYRDTRHTFSREELDNALVQNSLHVSTDEIDRVCDRLVLGGVFEREGHVFRFAVPTFAPAMLVNYDPAEQLRMTRKELG